MESLCCLTCWDLQLMRHCHPALLLTHLQGRKMHITRQHERSALLRARGGHKLKRYRQQFATASCNNLVCRQSTSPRPMLPDWQSFTLTSGLQYACTWKGTWVPAQSAECLWGLPILALTVCLFYRCILRRVQAPASCKDALWHHTRLAPSNMPTHMRTPPSSAC